MSTDNANPLPPGIRLRDKPEGNFCWQDNETYDVFQRIVGPHGTALYATLSRKWRNSKVEFSVRSLARITAQSASTVDRQLKVLEHVGMVRVTPRGGNRESICELFNLKDRIQSWGTQDERKKMIESLTCEVKDLRKKLGGKAKVERPGEAQTSSSAAPQHSETLVFPTFKRDAGVSPEVRQRSTRETHAGLHLLPQERRTQDAPSPTPSHIGEVESPEKLSSEDEPDPLLKWARVAFTGSMDDIRDHLFDTSRPPVQHLANGYADWHEFGFDSLAVQAAARRGEALSLVLSASDPAAVGRGLHKYRKTWEPSLRKWFECEVRVELRRAQRKW